MDVARVTPNSAPVRGPLHWPAANDARADREGAEHEHRRRRTAAGSARPQLLALVSVDGPVGRHRARGPAARGRPRPGGDPRLGRALPHPAQRADGTGTFPRPAQHRDARVDRLRRLSPRQDRLRQRGHHVRAGVPPGPRCAHRRPARCGGPRLPRPRTGQVAGRRPGAHRHAQRRLRGPAGRPGLRRPGARLALLRRTPRLESRGPLRLRHQLGACGHGGVESADAERLGPEALRSTCWGSTHSSIRIASAWSGSATAAP